MDPILELLERIGSDDPPTDEELAEAREELVELLDAAIGEDVAVPDLEAGQAIRAAIDKIDTEAEARETAAAEAAAEAARLREGVLDTSADTDEDTESDDDAETEDAEVEAPESAAIAAAHRLSGSTLARARSRRIDANASPQTGPSHIRVRTLSVAAGEHVASDAGLDRVADVFANSSGSVRNPGAKERLVRWELDYPAERVLSSEQRGDNDAVIESLLSPRAIAAAGGICDPLPADFEHPVCSDRGRPIRDSLPRFQATRGGVRFSPAVSVGIGIGGSFAGITHWPIEVDESPGDEEKGCLVLDCELEDEAKVDAVVACVEIGNFQARFSPEFWRSRLDVLRVEHDRLAEQTAYVEMAGAATSVTFTGNGTIYSLLGAVDRAVAGLRSRHRYLGEIRLIAPAWAHQALRSAITGQQLGSAPGDALAAADAVIDTFFRVRGVNPTWSWDLGIFASQSAGALQDFPGDEIEFLLFPEGTYFFLDGGTLDLGQEITDSGLNAKNNRQAFWETFEKAVFRGCEALEVTVPVEDLCHCSPFDSPGA